MPERNPMTSSAVYNNVQKVFVVSVTRRRQTAYDDNIIYFIIAYFTRISYYLQIESVRRFRHIVGVFLPRGLAFRSPREFTVRNMIDINSWPAMRMTRLIENISLRTFVRVRDTIIRFA